MCRILQAKAPLRYTASTYDAADSMLRDSDFGRGRRVITFANIPARQGGAAFDHRFHAQAGTKCDAAPVEIEFAGNIFP